MYSSPSMHIRKPARAKQYQVLEFHRKAGMVVFCCAIRSQQYCSEVRTTRTQMLFHFRVVFYAFWIPPHFTQLEI